MRILHTSDWHLGRSLYGKKRYEEFDAFLDWLAATIVEQQVDLLLVAGDIFDTATPGTRTQQLYYRFLCQVAASSCRHLLIVAGNHDSPSFLEAPKGLLKALDIHLTGAWSQNISDHLLLLKDREGRPELIVCAVPYLRDSDIRLVEPGETLEDKGGKLADAVRDCYARVAAEAELLRSRLGADIPIVATGHLFAAGGKTVDGDGVRELYIGTLLQLEAGIFPDSFDYVALGHLHIPQKVGGKDHIRYSGSPLPIGFGEARQQKQLCLVQFDKRVPAISSIAVPTFRRLEQISGDLDTMLARIAELSAVDADCWLELLYQGDQIVADLRERLEQAVSGGRMEILRISSSRIGERVMESLEQGESLEQLEPEEVFNRCLDTYNVAMEQRPELLAAYRETLLSIYGEKE